MEGSIESENSKRIAKRENVYKYYFTLGVYYAIIGSIKNHVERYKKREI